MKENNFLFLALLFSALLSCAVGALRAEEAGPWYLISETELWSIEQYRKNSEAEKQTWLLQAQNLQTRAERSETLSNSLDGQLLTAREVSRRLTQSFNELENVTLDRLSSMSGEIAALEQERAGEALKAEKYKGLFMAALVTAAALALSWVVCIGIKVCKFLKISPIQ